ncbi:MAG: WG repeat-containing protein [Alistipes sp.]|jgi:hypothetical protein|nr:WG repeat-containing protein [Alistipes sp.]
MTITVSQYLEAITSPDGRMRTLEAIRPVRDESGWPVFSIPGHGLVDFECEPNILPGAQFGDGRYTLRCPLKYDRGAAAGLRALSSCDTGLESKFFSEWRLLEKEIVLFDDYGRAFEVDILARRSPVGESLIDFLSRAASRRDFGAVDAAARSAEELFRWAGDIDRGISLDKVLVSPDGSLRVRSFSATDETGRIRLVLDSAAGGYKSEEMQNIRLVRDGGGWMFVDRLGRAVINDVWRSAEPFRGGRAEVETWRGRGLIDTRGRRVLEPVYEEVVWDEYWGLATTMADGRWALTDREGVVLTAESYDWLGECSEGMVLAQKGDKCGFLDTRGRVVVPCVYDDASSFCEGYALVSLDGEEFFIDRLGRRL